MLLTNPKRTDGFGAQFQTIIGSFIYAQVHGLEFCYTPFEKMEHDYENDPDFLEKKEKLIGWKDHFPPLKDTAVAKSPQEIVYFMDHVQWNRQPLAVEALEKIKDIFWKGKHEPMKCIAVHIRRKNIHDSRDMGTQVPDAYFLKWIGEMKKDYPDLPVHIYSQGKAENFQAFQSFHLYLNESVEDTFTDLVQAQVLMTSPSSFSYSAALLSRGTVYFHPFWHQPLPHWKKINN